MSYSNYDDVLDQMRDGGLLLDGRDLPLHIGRMRRVRIEGERERKGWYIIHELSMDGGDMVLVGSFGIWRGLDNGACKIELRKRELSKEQREALRVRLAEDRKRAKAQREREQQRAALRAFNAWRQCTPTWTRDGAEIATNSYLEKKGLGAAGAHGARFSPTGALVIPMMDTKQRVYGLQFIYPRDTHKEQIERNEGKDKKFWPAGLAKQGHFFLMGPSPDVAGVVIVTEGYATGVQLLEATPKIPVAVCFDAGNMQLVGEALRKHYRRTKILFAADDDAFGKCPNCKKLTPQPAPTCVHCGGDTRKLQNAGVTAAELSTLAVPESAWAAPRFADADARRMAALHSGKKITDWNDLALIESPRSVAVQIEDRLRELKWVAAESSAPTRPDGEAGQPPQVFTLETLLSNYTLIYGTETVFDHHLARILTLSSLRAAAKKENVRAWLEDARRRMVLPEEVGFDPAGANKSIKCNLWRGWPTTPKQGRCDRILELLEWLCSLQEEGEAREVYHWILKWLAYPIQNPGAKMQTAVLMHGTEGAGKNKFFGVVREIYGRYGGIFGQTELESQFNGWASGKLFMIGNEVVTRVELYHQQGRLKNMVTENEWQVNEKNLPARMEHNHCNFVFFSNRIDIAKLDREDRRYCVVWTPPALGEEFYREVAAEISSGGVEALHHHLLTLDVGDFSEHTKPPVTRAKRELIELGMDSTERFWLAWVEGDLPVPCCPCTAQDLYAVYQRWGRAEGVPKLAQLNTLIGTLGKKPGVEHGPMNYYPNTYYRASEVVKSRILMPPLEMIPKQYRKDGIKTKTQYLTDCIVTFRQKMEGFGEND